MKDKYVIITPVRNEEDYIEMTIKSVVNQKVPPVEYIIVNDGSTDGTEDIIDEYVEKYNWIKTIKRPPKEHSPGGGIVNAFYEGYNILDEKEWDYVVKLDADLRFNENYFKALLKNFDENNKLGISSGKTYELKAGEWHVDSMPDDHVRGAAKMYRKQCWEDIDGLREVLGWDTIDELEAQVKGWDTRSYAGLVLEHYKPIGTRQTKIVRREIKAGERQHYLGYLPLFAIFRGFYRMFQKPYFIAGILNIYGFILASFKGSEQIDNHLIAHLRKKQKQRLLLKRKLIN